MSKDSRTDITGGDNSVVRILMRYDYNKSIVFILKKNHLYNSSGSNVLPLNVGVKYKIRVVGIITSATVQYIDLYYLQKYAWPHIDHTIDKKTFSWII